MNTMGDYHDLHLQTYVKYMKCYDSIKESKCITYLDANNLYGWAISQYIPIVDLNGYIKKN